MTVQINRTTGTTATTSGFLQAGQHTPVDATSGSVTMTLPTATHVGASLSVEKIDATANTVTLSGSIRGGSTTLALTNQFEARDLLWTGSTWRVLGDAVPSDLKRVRSRGVWAGSTAYAVNDLVNYNGSAYICLTAHTSGTPFSVGSNWVLIARGASVGTVAPTSPLVNDLWVDTN